MTRTVNISKALYQAAETTNADKPTVDDQIEHWAKIGKVAEENPDLPYHFIKDVLEAREEMLAGNVTIYTDRG